MKVDIQVWSNERIIDEFVYESEVNQLETVERFSELLDELSNSPLGDGFTLMANKISEN